MQEKYILGEWEISMILINAVLCKMFTGYTKIFGQISGSGQMFTVITVSLLTGLLFYTIAKLSEKFECSDIIDIAKIAFGKIGSVIIGIFMIIFLIISCIFTLREFVMLMQEVFMQSSPILYIMLFFIAAMIAGCLSGMDSIARMHTLIVPIIIFITMVISLSLIIQSDFSNLFPIMGTGAMYVFGKGLFMISFFTDFLILLLLSPFAAKGCDMRRVGLKSLTVSSILLLLMTTAYMLASLNPFSKEYGILIYQMTKLVSYGRFFERVDSFFIMCWSLSAMMYMSILLFLTSHIFKKIFDLPKSRPTVWIFLSFIVFGAYMFKRNIAAHEFVFNSIYYLWIPSFLLPLIIIWIARRRST